MGKAYTIVGVTEQQALDRGVKFADRVINKFNRNCHLLGVTNKNASKWEAIVDVCGKPDLKVAELARDVNEGKYGN